MQLGLELKEVQMQMNLNWRDLQKHSRIIQDEDYLDKRGEKSKNVYLWQFQIRTCIKNILFTFNRIKICNFCYHVRLL